METERQQKSAVKLGGLSSKIYKKLNSEFMLQKSCMEPYSGCLWQMK